MIKLLCFDMSQSPELSGTAWFNLSAVQLGLVVWFIESYSICSCSICKPVVCLPKFTKHSSRFTNYIVLMQVSGSLYGALFGSLLVYPIADFLGLYFALHMYFIMRFRV